MVFLKFSERKKAKIRKINQRRVKRVHKYMIGRCIGYEPRREVIDQSTINDVMYLLVEEDGKYAIYKIAKVFEYVGLSPKRILQNQKYFSDHMNWRAHSVIQINEEGKIESVKRAVMRAAMNNKGYTYVVV